MSTGQYGLGVILLMVVVGSLVVTACLVRRMLLPSWSQAPARVAEAVIALGVVVVVCELLGTVAAFKRWPVVLCCAAIAGAVVVVFRRRAHAVGVAAPTAVPLDELPPPRPGVAPTAAAILVVALASLRWMQYALSALHAGMREFDTVTYHMPFAARFVQDASVTGLQYVGNAPVSFYPANSELIHGLGILLFQRDVLSPVLNLGWLGFALLAAWCIGRPAGVAPATMAATALVASLQVMVSSQAGTAKNDIVGLALLLAAVALWINASGSPAALVLAALAAGLAVGTRLNVWASVLALGAVVVVTTQRGRRSRAAAWGALGVVVGGGFWYVRNLVAVGNPLPWFGVKLAGVLTLSSTTAPTDCGRTSVAHYITNPAFVKAHLVPQLESSFGGRWWMPLSLAAAGVGGGLLARGFPIGRALAVVALISGVGYVLTPATAGGVQARCFAFNTRFAAPALILGIIVLPLALSRRGIHPLIAVLAILVALLLDVHLPFAPAPVLATILLVTGATTLALGVWRALPRRALIAALAFLGVVGALAGWREQRIYLRDRYRQPNLADPVEPISSVLRRVSHARVAVTGFDEIYPLYGLDLSNRVELPAARVGARFAPYSNCPGWLAALHRGHYNYVVTALESDRNPPAAAWTRRYPGAREVFASGPGAQRRGVPWRWQLFQLTPARRVDPRAACTGLGSPSVR